MVKIDLRNRHRFTIPPRRILQKCFNIVASHQNLKQSLVSVEIASLHEIQQLNKTYRKKNKPTNVLSFPFRGLSSLPNQRNLDYFLGDLVLCPEILQYEAKVQQKYIENHWCHLFIHGILHLIGYNHDTNDAAHKMEKTEIVLLRKMSIDNPYFQQ